MEVCAVGLGGGLGAICRYALSSAAQRNKLQPYGTACINVAGSFALGATLAALPTNSKTRLLAGTGFCGGFTTFSTYAVEGVELWNSGKAMRAVGYVIGTNVCCLGAAGAGLAFGSGMLRRGRR